MRQHGGEGDLLSVRLGRCDALSGPPQPCDLVTGHVSLLRYFLMSKMEIIIPSSKAGGGMKIK